MNDNTKNKQPWHNVSCWTITIDVKKGHCIATHTYSDRFDADKVFVENENEVIALDGVVLNKNEILQKHGLSNLSDFCRLLDEKPYLAKELIGPFTIFIYNKREYKGRAYSNQTGDATVFYSYDNSEKIVLSNSFLKVNETASKALDTLACHQLLTYGFLIDDRTINKNVKRLQAGKMIEIGSEGLGVKTYHRFKYNNPIDITLEEAIETLDVKFRKAVKRCFDKDLEYGYKHHLVDISAGLDSRMVNWVANDLGYKHVINISYSQSGSTESKYSTMLAHRLKNVFYQRSLDDASFLYDVENMVCAENGLAYYCGITGGFQFLNLIDFDDIGLEHTGQIGDVVIGSFVKEQSGKVDIDNKRTSSSLTLRKEWFDEVANECDCQEEFLIYSRAFQGALSTHYMRSHYTYAVSPFLDVDLMEFCASLPVALRCRHLLYWAWIDKKYPEAGRIPSSRVRLVNLSPAAKIKMLSDRLLGRLQRDLQKLKNKVGISTYAATADNMNPHDYWYQTNEQVRHFISNYIDEHIALLASEKELQADVLQLSSSSRCLDKLMAVSLLATINVFIKK